MADSSLGPQWRHLASVLRGERAITKSARQALQHLLDYAGDALAGGGYDPSVLSVSAADWRDTTTLASLLGDVNAVFLSAWGRAARGDVDPDVYAARHLEAVTNRLSGIPDEVFDTMRGELLAGRLAQEGIPQLAARVNALLTDDQRWTNRAVTIARTEAIGASNAGGHGSAYASAELLGEDPAMVVKEWMATNDSRTRETHAQVDGTQVLGLDTAFSVGESELQFAADPDGDAAEVVNCRCTTIYVYPGDPDYPDEFAPDAQVLEMAGPQNVDAPGLVVDSGPQSAAEHAARQMTAEELAMETTTRGGMPQRAAKTELARRGLTAALQAEDVHGEMNGVLVVMLPAADDPVQTIGPETKHVSLLMYGDADVVTQEADGMTGYGPDFRSVLESTVAGYAGIIAPFSDNVTGIESLGDNAARVWMLDPQGCCSYVEGDLPQYESEVTPPPSEYPEYLPHVTIGYADPAVPEEQDGTLAPEVEDAAAQVTAIRFDRIAVWWAGEQTEWPLTGTDQEETPVTDTPPAQAALAQHTAAMRDRMIAAFDAAVADATAPFADTPLPEDQPAAEGTPAVAQDIAPDGDPLYGILWPEATQSGDMRMVEAGVTVWRDLPLPLMAQDAQAMGHDGAVRIGRIDHIERDATTYAVPVIRYSGVWDTSEAAVETRRQVDAGVARGVSVDGDDVTVELRGSDGQPLDPMVDDFPEDGVVIESATAARVAGATVCSIPAFQQAYVRSGVYTPGEREPGWNSDGTPLASGQVPEDSATPADPVLLEDGELAPVMASAWSLVAAGGPVWATSDFANPQLTQPTRLTVTDDGRVYGHLATWGVCHIGIDGVCQEPPVSATNYAYFATGSVETDAGLASVGQLTMETGHAPMPARWRAAAAHYDNTGTAVADVAMGQDAVGIWFSGRLRPGTTPEQVYAMRAVGSVSGDWRQVGGQLELVAALVCNVPGFPIPVPSVAASGARPTAMVASGVVHPTREVQDAAGRQVGTIEPAALVAAVETVLAARDLRARATTAAARLRVHRAQEARRRLTVHQTRRATAALARIERS